MLIRVRYIDGRQDMVTPDQLGEMIRRRQIRKFKRAYGWADILSSPTRERQLRRSPYLGADRRQARRRRLLLPSI